MMDLVEFTIPLIIFGIVMAISGIIWLLSDERLNKPRQTSEEKSEKVKSRLKEVFNVKIIDENLLKSILQDMDSLENKDWYSDLDISVGDEFYYAFITQVYMVEKYGKKKTSESTESSTKPEGQLLD